MLSGEKILVTGPTGQIGLPLATRLAEHNEVWGLARFTDQLARQRVEKLGVKTIGADIAEGDLSEVPDDFTYVLHLAATQLPGFDYDTALRVNAEGTGLLLAHCRKAKAALVMSSHSVYQPDADPWRAYKETDPLGDSHPVHSPTYAVSKLAQEAVARTCARAFGLPVVVARMNAAYGPAGGLPMLHLDAMLSDKSVHARHDPQPYSPIHEDDIATQLPALLDAASVPATVVNWAGDEAVSVQEWCSYFGEWTGRASQITVTPQPGTQPGAVADVTRRLTLTGPCGVGWREGMHRAGLERHPDLGEPR